jgi:hypothetical protein
MAYYFECETCNTREYFSSKDLLFKYDLKTPKAKKQSYETVICKSCISKKVRLKGNYIIIEKGNK